MLRFGALYIKLHTKMALMVTRLCTRFTRPKGNLAFCRSEQVRSYRGGGMRGSSLADDIPRMQPAFLLRGFFPPPAAFALMLAGQYRPGAGLAADADEAALMQAVVRQLQHE